MIIKIDKLQDISNQVETLVQVLKFNFGFWFNKNLI